MNKKQQEMENFAEAYIKHEVLWNAANRSYRNKGARDTALLAIAGELSISFKDVQTKIKSLRLNFRQHKQRVEKSTSSGSGKEDLYNPPSWYKIMDDAIGHTFVETRETYDNLVSKVLLMNLI